MIMAKGWLVALSLLSCQNVLAIALPSTLKHKSSTVSIPIREVELDPDHPLARRQTDIGFSGGPARGYNVQINVGSSQTPVSVLLDTGSGDLVLASGVIPQDGSSTDTGQPCVEQYGSQNAKQGKLTQGSYAFAGYQANSYFCNLDLGINGILGLTYVNPNRGVGARTGQNPLNQFEGAGLSSFSIYLANYANGGGEFTPNDYDATFIAPGGGFSQEPVNTYNSGFWGLDLTSTFSYAGATYDLGISSGIIDTGTPGIVLPPATAQQIWRLTGADENTGSYGSNCNPGGDDVVFTSASGYSYAISAAVYVIRNPDGSCRSAFAAKTQQGTQNNPLAILGAAWIRQYYTYFDVDNGVMYFAPSGG